jgi:hypothetical protein
MVTGEEGEAAAVGSATGGESDAGVVGSATGEESGAAAVGSATGGESDEEFLARFEAHDLDGFSHRDHLRMAFAYARRGGVPAAVDGARRLRGVAEAHGAPGKYHETITVAWARLVGGLASAHPSLEFSDLLAEHPELLRRDLLSDYYSREVLFSDAARIDFLPPDRRPLP